MARILFTISLALAALSVAVSGAPTTNKGCEGGDCEVFVERSEEACDYVEYGDEDEFTKRDWHVSPYCMTPWEYDVVLRMCDDDLDDLEDFYEEFYDEFYDEEDWDDAMTKRHRRPVFNRYSNLPPRCFPYPYYNRFQTMVGGYAARDAVTKRTFIPGNYHQGYGHHGGNHRGYCRGMTGEECEDWMDEHN